MWLRGTTSWGSKLFGAADVCIEDMTSPSYRYITRLNALRRAYFGSFGWGAYDLCAFKLEARGV